MPMTISTFARQTKIYVESVNKFRGVLRDRLAKAVKSASDESKAEVEALAADITTAEAEIAGAPPDEMPTQG